jgi:hypothetical protein
LQKSFLVVIFEFAKDDTIPVFICVIIGCWVIAREDLNFVLEAPM